MVEASQATNLSQWISAAFSLLGVLVGGIVTYLANAGIERKRSRHEFDRRAIADAYVPLCSAIEAFESYHRQLRKNASGDTAKWFLPMYIAEEFESLSTSLYNAKSAGMSWLFTVGDRSSLYWGADKWLLLQPPELR